jgi:hypothetical protein
MYIFCWILWKFESYMCGNHYTRSSLPGSKILLYLYRDKWWKICQVAIWSEGANICNYCHVSFIHFWTLSEKEHLSVKLCPVNYHSKIFQTKTKRYGSSFMKKAANSVCPASKSLENFITQTFYSAGLSTILPFSKSNGNASMTVEVCWFVIFAISFYIYWPSPHSQPEIASSSSHDGRSLFK